MRPRNIIKLEENIYLAPDNLIFDIIYYQINSKKQVTMINTKKN